MEKTGRLIAALIGMYALPSQAFDGIAVEYGDGLGEVDLIRLSLVANQWDHPPDDSEWNLRIHWEIGLAYWHASHTSTGVTSLLNANVTPVLRLLQTRGTGVQPYVEAGIGAHVLTQDQIEDRTLSSTYHFGSHAGLGLLTGGGHAIDLGLRLQHLSNASLETPNPGINFAIARIGWRF